MFGQNAGGLGLGILAVLLGAAGIAGALRIRRRRARYPETYASSGGMLYTAVQIGCSSVLLLGGLGLISLALIYKR